MSWCWKERCFQRDRPEVQSAAAGEEVQARVRSGCVEDPFASPIKLEYKLHNYTALTCSNRRLRVYEVH